MEETKQKKTKINKHTKQKINRRNNAKLYPLYKMVSWDLLCFYSIEFLFYTITKGLTASQVLIITACLVLFKILMQTTAVTITDMLGHRKSLIIGNALMLTYIAGIMIAPNIGFIILACLARALGYDIKTIAETNLLYDSVSTKGGEGLYTLLDCKGAGYYYLLDGAICFVTGYLFVINNYLPMFICMGFIVLSTILAFKFKDIHEVEKKENAKITKVLKEYRDDLKTSVKFIVKSNRMKSYILFGSVFYGIITIIDTYRCDLLVDKGMVPEQYSMVFAILTLLAGISVTLSRKVHKKFKNRTITFISLTYIICCTTVGIIGNISNTITIPIIIIMYTVMKMASSMWYVIEAKYLKNFTTKEIRNKITFTYELIGGIVTSIFAIIGSLLLNRFEVSQAFLLVSLVGIIGIVLSLDYMRTRFGLRPKDYKKEDIDFKT